MQQEDQEFSGIISGLQVRILLNSKRIIFNVETPAKDRVYQSIIQHNDYEKIKQIQQTFINFHLLFDYIEKYAEDPQRVKIDLKTQTFIVKKNQGPRRLKKAPILSILLQRNTDLEFKKRTALQIEFEILNRQHEIFKLDLASLKQKRTQLIQEFKSEHIQLQELINKTGISELISIINQPHQDQLPQHQIKIQSLNDEINKKNQNQQSEFNLNEFPVDQQTHQNVSYSIFYSSQQILDENRQEDYYNPLQVQKNQEDFNKIQKVKKSYKSQQNSEQYQISLLSPFSYLS